MYECGNSPHQKNQVLTVKNQRTVPQTRHPNLHRCVTHPSQTSTSPFLECHPPLQFDRTPQVFSGSFEATALGNCVINSRALIGTGASICFDARPRSNKNTTQAKQLFNSALTRHVGNLLKTGHGLAARNLSIHFAVVKTPTSPITSTLAT